MTSPDFRNYIDLTLYDVQPSDIYLEAIDYAVTALPEFDSRPGTVEDALLQAMSFAAAQTVAAINRLPNGLMEGILRLLGFERREALFATGSCYFTAIDEVGGIDIPQGTLIGYTQVVNGSITQYVFQTTTAVTIPPGESQSPSVPIQAQTASTVPLLLSGQEMVILTASPRLYQAFLDSNIEEGADAEPDSTYFDRGVSYLASLSTALATASHIDNFVLSNFPEILRTKTYDLANLASIEPSALVRSSNSVTATVDSGHGITTGDVVRIYGAVPNTFDGIFEVDSTTGTTVVWTQSGTNASATTEGYLQSLENVAVNAAAEPGYVTIFVAGADGASVVPESKTEIYDAVTERTIAGLGVVVADAIIAPFDIAVSYKVADGFDTITISNSIKLFLEDLLSPNSWDWSGIVRRNVIISLVSQIAGVEYVEDVTFTVAENDLLAFINETTSDVEFYFKGTLPLATVEVTGS